MTSACAWFETHSGVKFGWQQLSSGIFKRSSIWGTIDPRRQTGRPDAPLHKGDADGSGATPLDHRVTLEGVGANNQRELVRHPHG